MKKFLMKIKVRFFDTDALLETLNLFNRVEIDKLPERLKKDVELGRLVVAGELVRRGVAFW